MRNNKNGIFAAIAIMAIFPATVSWTQADDPPAPTPVPAPAATAGGDIPGDFKVVTDADDYIKRDAMIPMRDGVKLYTVIVIPKGATHAPMILDRTPYGADKFVSSSDSPHRAMALPIQLRGALRSRLHHRLPGCSREI